MLAANFLMLLAAIFAQFTAILTLLMHIATMLFAIIPQFFFILMTLHAILMQLHAVLLHFCFACDNARSIPRTTIIAQFHTVLVQLFPVSHNLTVVIAHGSTVVAQRVRIFIGRAGGGHVWGAPDICRSKYQEIIEGSL